MSGRDRSVDSARTERVRSPTPEWDIPGSKHFKSTSEKRKEIDDTVRSFEFEIRSIFPILTGHHDTFQLAESLRDIQHRVAKTIDSLKRLCARSHLPSQEFKDWCETKRRRLQTIRLTRLELDDINDEVHWQLEAHCEGLVALGAETSVQGARHKLLRIHAQYDVFSERLKAELAQVASYVNWDPQNQSQHLRPRPAIRLDQTAESARGRESGRAEAAGASSSRQSSSPASSASQAGRSEGRHRSPAHDRKGKGRAAPDPSRRT